MVINTIIAVFSLVVNAFLACLTFLAVCIAIWACYQGCLALGEAKRARSADNRPALVICNRLGEKDLDDDHSLAIFNAGKGPATIVLIGFAAGPQAKRFPYSIPMRIREFLPPCVDVKLKYPWFSFNAFAEAYAGAKGIDQPAVGFRSLVHSRRELFPDPMKCLIQYEDILEDQYQQIFYYDAITKEINPGKCIRVPSDSPERVGPKSPGGMRLKELSTP